MKRKTRAKIWAGIGVAAVIAVLLGVMMPAAKWVHHRGERQAVQGYDAQIQQHAEAAGLPVALVRSMVLAESGGDPNARSSRKAVGLMQITPVTLEEVKRLNKDFPSGNLTDPDYNLRVGTTYLAYLIKRFDDDVPLAITAYHMGPTRVRRIQKANPGITTDQIIAKHAGPQTRAYVKIVTEGM